MLESRVLDNIYNMWMRVEGPHKYMVTTLGYYTILLQSLITYGITTASSAYFLLPPAVPSVIHVHGCPFSLSSALT